ncbi:MAG: SigE family polymerase sigma factor [Ilumatobacteraceae bacterium]|nr:SigE family polymerase sigma factor [Ilumatobacteraceae bacterium]
MVEMQHPVDITILNEGVQRNVDDGFATVFADHHAAVLKLAVLLSGDRHVADEITADVFARVLPKWRTGVIENPLQYLRRAVVNEVRSRHRRRVHERRAIARYSSQIRAEGDLTPETNRDPLVAALAELPVRQRTVVVLRYHDDVSEIEVARILGVSVGTVKTHSSRALAHLRRILEEGA